MLLFLCYNGKKIYNGHIFLKKNDSEDSVDSQNLSTY